MDIRLLLPTFFTFHHCFDSFAGTWLFVNSLVRLNLFLMRNGELIEQPIYLPTLTDKIVQESINFIKQSSTESEFLGIISWPSQLPEGVSYNHPTSQMDLLPTLIDLMNTTYPAEDDRELDGDSWTPWLTKANPEEYFQSRIMFHYCGVYLHGVRFAQDPSTIYKIYYYTPNYTKPAEKKCKFVCQCFGKHVIAHNPPIIYNIAMDPKEESPLPHNQSLIDYVDQQVALHQSTLDPNVESQFSLSNSIWKPWMQPCCNPPFCSCKEKVENNVNDFV